LFKQKLYADIFIRLIVLFKGIKSRPEAVASFMAVLELIKLKKIMVEGDNDNLEVKRIADEDEFSLDMIED